MSIDIDIIDRKENETELNLESSVSQRLELGDGMNDSEINTGFN